MSVTRGSFHLERTLYIYILLYILYAYGIIYKSSLLEKQKALIQVTLMHIYSSAMRVLFLLQTNTSTIDNIYFLSV